MRIHVQVSNLLGMTQVIPQVPVGASAFLLVWRQPTAIDNAGYRGQVRNTCQYLRQEHRGLAAAQLGVVNLL